MKLPRDLSGRILRGQHQPRADFQIEPVCQPTSDVRLQPVIGFEIAPIDHSLTELGEHRFDLGVHASHEHRDSGTRGVGQALDLQTRRDDGDLFRYRLGLEYVTCLVERLSRQPIVERLARLEPGMLERDMARAKPHRRVDPVFVRSVAERSCEDKHGHAKTHREPGQYATTTLAPDVTYR